MIKTIFVPASGSSTDTSVFATALALARPCAAHLQFLHMHPAPSEAAVRAPHVELCRGPAIDDALEHLRRQGDQLCADAIRHFQDFCETNEVAVTTAPGAQECVTASWTQETRPLTERFMLHARHSDLIVLGRARNEDYMPAGLIENLLLSSGRPIVIAADESPRNMGGTIVVGWKETPEAARALAASMPLLRQAKRVVLISVAEDQAASVGAVRDLARQLEWHRVNAEVNALGGDGRSTASRLTEAAARLGAQLLVVGGYGHRPVREMIFGGVTQELIDQAGMPVLLMH